MEDERSLDMTQDEIDKLAKALKDDKFRELLRNYAEELSDPKNRKKYEEEIRLLEQERGNTIEFIHPTPFKALRTSLNGKQKCYINICGNGKVAKPECRYEVTDSGQAGQRWSLPYNLHPGREERNAKGNKIMIYDVIFHPDTLSLASKNKRFMDMLDSTAIEGVQSNLKVVLDQNNLTELKTKYKGVQVPCVVRKPISGFKAEQPTGVPDPLAFPYPDAKRPHTPKGHLKTADSVDNTPTNVEKQQEKSKEPTKPLYTLKYRSHIDMQDFRLARDSAQSPRPREIVVTFDVPLLKSVAHTNLEVQDKVLLLESQRPEYKVEVPLAYPVDEDQAEAKFDKQKGQLTVILPVLPSQEALAFAASLIQPVLAKDSQEGDQGDEEEAKSMEEIEDKTEGDNVEEKLVGNKHEGRLDPELGEERDSLEQRTGSPDGVEGDHQCVAEECHQGSPAACLDESNQEPDDGEMERAQETLQIEQMLDSEKTEVEAERPDVQEEHRQKEQSESHRENGDRCGRAECEDDPGIEKVQQPGTTTGDQGSVGAEMTHLDSHLDSPEPENCKTLTTAGAVAMLQASSVTAAEVRPVKAPEESRKTQRDVQDSGEQQNKLQEEARVTSLSSSELRSDQSALDAVKEVTPGSVTCEDTDEDDFFKVDTEVPPAVLREVDSDGNEIVICDHSTHVEFIFQNPYVFELD